MPSSYAALNYHLVFSTKNRVAHITSDIQERLYSYVGGIVRKEKGQLIAAGGIPDHVHFLMTLHPTIAVADLMRVVKANSSKWLHESFPSKAGFGWQDGYGAFTVSNSNIDQVKKYIADQEEHHRTMTFQEEFIVFLKKHNIPYDERYIWA